MEDVLGSSGLLCWAGAAILVGVEDAGKADPEFIWLVREGSPDGGKIL
jgi:hypothetical protein